MIPFLKNKEASTASASEPIQRKPDDGSEPDYDGMEAAAEDLIAAVHSKDAKAVAAALRAAFEIADSEPHEEGPHIG